MPYDWNAANDFKTRNFDGEFIELIVFNYESQTIIDLRLSAEAYESDGA